MNFANITEQFSHSLYSVYEIFTEGTIRALPTSWVPPHGKYMNELRMLSEEARAELVHLSTNQGSQHFLPRFPDFSLLFIM